MPRFFTHFWPDDRCDMYYREGLSGEPLEYTAGTGFLRKEVASGDIIYIISVYEGQFLLLGRIEVWRIITSNDEAIVAFGEGLKEANEYVLPIAGTATPLQFTRQIAWETVGELRFIGLDGSSKPLKLAGHEEVDAVALTGVRELTAASARLLDLALAEPFQDQPTDDADDEEAEEISDEDLTAIVTVLPDSGKDDLLHAAALRFAVKAFEDAGWTVKHNDHVPRFYDLICVQDGHELFLTIKGVETDELVFTMKEMEYTVAEQDAHYAVCIVTRALSKRPRLSTFTADDLYELFDARPLSWVFRYRGEEWEEE